MIILHLLGNGFDVNLGMKTRYSDFYKYYLSQASDNEAVKDLKHNLQKNIDNWSDLELEFGNYTQYIKSIDQFDLVYEDLINNLAEYLKKIESNYEYTNLDKQRFYNDLSFPEKYLLTADKNKIELFRDRWSNSETGVYLITFNYTNTIERIIEEMGNNLGIRNNHYIYLRNIEHIHGFLDDRMVLGVNDNSQIKNQAFHQDPDITDLLIKENCYKAQKHTIDDTFHNLISSANLITIFGSSIGETDKVWWRHIGEQLKRDTFRLIIFYKCNEISPRISQKKERLARQKIKEFLGKTDLNEKEQEIVKERILIGLNCDIFKLRTSELQLHSVKVN